MESAVTEYNDKLRSVADELAPAKERTVTVRPDCPWYTAELADLKRERRRLESKANTSCLAVDSQNYKAHRDSYNDISKRTKQ